MVPGQSAPIAHAKKRELPEWYKPYTLNYFGNGWLAVTILGTCLCKIYPKLTLLIINSCLLI